MENFWRCISYEKRVQKHSVILDNDPGWIVVYCSTPEEFIEEVRTRAKRKALAALLEKKRV